MYYTPAERVRDCRSPSHFDKNKNDWVEKVSKVYEICNVMVKSPTKITQIGNFQFRAKSALASCFQFLDEAVKQTCQPP